MGFGIVRVDPNDIETVQITKGDAVERFQFASEDKMEQLRVWRSF